MQSRLSGRSRLFNQHLCGGAGREHPELVPEQGQDLFGAREPPAGARDVSSQTLAVFVSVLDGPGGVVSS